VSYLAIVWIAGVVVAIPVILWWARDIGRISHGDWFWAGYHRRHWQYGVLLGWIAGGWIAIVIIIVWSRSEQRSELLAEAASRTRRKDDWKTEPGA